MTQGPKLGYNVIKIGEEEEIAFVQFKRETKMSIKKLTSRHRLMIIALAVEGLTPNEVCEKFEFTASRLSVLRSSPLWKAEEDKLQQESLRDSKMRIASLRERAIGALGECVESIDERIKLASARDILDRTGVKAGQEIDFSGADQTINLYVPPNWNVAEGEG